MNWVFLLGQEAPVPGEAGVPIWQRVAAIVTLLAQPSGRLCLATLLGAVGLFLLMPGRTRRGSIFGGMSLIVAAASLFSLVPMEANGTFFLFWILAGLTVSAAVATVTSRSPVYCAIWFAITLLGTGGLFLINGAQFLGIATIAVYAGAIVVTFLFVLMLAQPEGHTYYDRVSWGRVSQAFGCFAGAAFTSILVWSFMELPSSNAVNTERVLLSEQHVATLGGQLFSSHLIAVEVAGTVLLAALVGAVAIASHGEQRWRSARGRVSQGSSSSRNGDLGAN